jgi:hypothetical protein
MLFGELFIFITGAPHPKVLKREIKETAIL